MKLNDLFSGEYEKLMEESEATGRHVLSEHPEILELGSMSMGPGGCSQINITDPEIFDFKRFLDHLTGLAILEPSEIEVPDSTLGRELLEYLGTRSSFYLYRMP